MANKRTPLNYLGNKSRIVDQILSVFPKKVDLVVEPFAGSAVVSLNSNAKNIILIDSNFWTIELLTLFSTQNPNKIIDDTFQIIDKFNLSHYKNLDKNFKEKKHEGYSDLNKKGYNELRNSFNESNNIKKLFVLIIYSFNHYMRFNKFGEFNAPVGKGHFYKNFEHIIKNYANFFKDKDLTFLNIDYQNFNFSKIENTKTTIFYIDPPYLITTAPYNDNWNVDKEKELYNWIDKNIQSKGFKFILSNVIEANGKTNDILKKWIEKNSFIVLELNRKYENSNYRKKDKKSKEIIVKNYS